MKLSELIEQGAAVSVPLEGDYIGAIDGELAACAMGCAFLALDENAAKELADNNMRRLIKEMEVKVGHDIWSLYINLADLPDHVRMMCQTFTTAYKVDLFTLIYKTSDMIGRDAAIQLVKSLEEKGLISDAKD